MIGKHITNGASAVGLFRYLTEHRHRGSETPESRAAWVETLASPSADSAITLRRMAGVVADASTLKKLSGRSAAGRKTNDPYAHFVFSWPAGERPGKEEMIDAARSGLAAVGLDDHLTLLVAHEDAEAVHVHAICLRINAYTGITNALGRSNVALSTWAEEYERDHGGIVIPTRVKRREEREAFRKAIAEEMADFVPPVGGTKRQQSKARAAYRREATKRLRESGQHQLTTTTRTRGAGQEPHTLQEQNQWKIHYAAESGTKKERRAARAALAARQAQDRLQREHLEELAPPPAVQKPVTPEAPTRPITRSRGTSGRSGR